MGLQAASSESGSTRAPRADRRYPLAADVAYRFLGDYVTSAGHGYSINMSSSGILIATDTALPVGVPIALQITWPAKPDRIFVLILHVRGRTLRCTGNQTAIAIAGYQFGPRRQAEMDRKAAAAVTEASLIVQDDVQQRTVNLQSSVVVDEP